MPARRRSSCRNIHGVGTSETVAAGKAEAGFGLTTANYLASVGKGMFKKPVKGVMALTVLYTQLAHTVIAVDSGVTSDPVGEQPISAPPHPWCTATMAPPMLPGVTPTA